MAEDANERWKEWRLAKKRSHRHSAARKLAAHWLRADIEQQSRLLEAIEGGARLEPDMATLVAITIVRMAKPDVAAAMASRMVALWPANFEYWFTWSNSSFLSPRFEDRLAGFQQRLIGKAVMQVIQPKLMGQEAVNDHFLKVAEVRDFLDGKTPAPSPYVRDLQTEQAQAPTIDTGFIERLERVPDLAGIPPAVPGPRGPIIVVDTNAIAHPHVREWFAHRHVRFQAPPEVLFEFSQWAEFTRIPWGFAWMKIVPVTRPIPPEIRGARSVRKPEGMSRCDQLVATLALQSNANAVVSHDRDLWDSNLAHRIEKEGGRRIEILQPPALSAWIRRCSPCAAPDLEPNRQERPTPTWRPPDVPSFAPAPKPPD